MYFIFVNWGLTRQRFYNGYLMIAFVIDCLEGCQILNRQSVSKVIYIQLEKKQELVIKYIKGNRNF